MLIPEPSITVETAWLYKRISAPLGAISRALNEAIGRAVMGDPALRDLLIKTGNALDDVAQRPRRGDLR